MHKWDKVKQQLDKVVYTVVAVVVLFIVIVTMIGHMYKFSEEQSYEKLHLETLQIKTDINNQMVSDRENLVTMANFASKLHSDGESYGLIFKSFEEIGLFENIGILLPDNSFVTKIGKLNVDGKISFEEEAKKGEYVSGRVKDLTNDEREVVRSAVPVKDENGQTIAIIYGVINLEKLEMRYADDAESAGARLCVLERGNGNYIIDTENKNLSNITALAAASYKEGFSYEQLIDDLSDGKDGYSAFMSRNGDEYLYVHYAPMEVADWQIMLLQPENKVFAGAKATVSYLTTIAFVIILIMLIYIVLVFSAERKQSQINSCASGIRKSLLEVNQHIDKVFDALKNITEFSKARSSFIIDTYDEDYHYIVPYLKDKLLKDEDRAYFNGKLLMYAARHRTEHGAELYLSEITANEMLKKEMPDFYEFIKEHEIERVCFAVIINNNSNTHVLGVINPTRFYVMELLKEIAVTFSMAIFNKKHLARTEEMALTDSLTGTANRMAYKNDMKNSGLRKADLLACIYVDVNELHYFNNKNGHAAGDQMIIFIAEVLRSEFKGCRVYRMGGDEFLVFAVNLTNDEVSEKIKRANAQIEEMKYHVSFGVKFAEADMTLEETVNAAEKLMYDDKAKYYQNKELKKVEKLADRTMTTAFTGIKEVDACMSVMSLRYVGVYCVSHKSDTSRNVLVPSYFSTMLEEMGSYSKSLKRYIHDIVRPEYHRTLLSFLEFDVLEKQLADGHIPRVSYTKIDGEKIMLSIYPMPEHEDDMDTIWIFEKEDM